MEFSFVCDGTRTPTSCILKAFKQKKKIHASVELLTEDTNTSLIMHLQAAYECMTFNKISMLLLNS